MQESFEVTGGISLKGTLTPQGAKNEALQVLCAVLLTKEKVTISNVPNILDVRNFILRGNNLLDKVRKSTRQFAQNDIDAQLRIRLDQHPPR